MKITKRQLQKYIKEELSSILREQKPVDVKRPEAPGGARGPIGPGYGGTAGGDPRGDVHRGRRSGYTAKPEATQGFDEDAWAQEVVRQHETQPPPQTKGEHAATRGAMARSMGTEFSRAGEYAQTGEVPARSGQELQDIKTIAMRGRNLPQHLRRESKQQKLQRYIKEELQNVLFERERPPGLEGIGIPDDPDPELLPQPQLSTRGRMGTQDIYEPGTPAPTSPDDPRYDAYMDWVSQSPSERHPGYITSRGEHISWDERQQQRAAEREQLPETNIDMPAEYIIGAREGDWPEDMFQGHTGTPGGYSSRTRDALIDRFPEGPPPRDRPPTDAPGFSPDQAWEPGARSGYGPPPAQPVWPGEEGFPDWSYVAPASPPGTHYSEGPPESPQNRELRRGETGIKESLTNDIIDSVMNRLIK